MTGEQLIPAGVGVMVVLVTGKAAMLAASKATSTYSFVRSRGGWLKEQEPQEGQECSYERAKFQFLMPILDYQRAEVVPKELINGKKNRNASGDGEHCVPFFQVFLNPGPHLWCGLWNPKMHDFIVVHVGNALPHNNNNSRIIILIKNYVKGV